MGYCGPSLLIRSMLGILTQEQPRGVSSGCQIWSAWLKVYLKHTEVSSAKQCTLFLFFPHAPQMYNGTLPAKNQVSHCPKGKQQDSKSQHYNTETLPKQQPNIWKLPPYPPPTPSFFFLTSCTYLRGPGLNCWAAASCSPLAFLKWPLTAWHVNVKL